MTTQRIVVPKDQWVKVTDVSTDGTIEVAEGSVRITEQSTLPTGTAQEVPKSGRLTGNGATGFYVKVNTGEFVYAYGMTDSEIDVTPVGDL